MDRKIFQLKKNECIRTKGKKEYKPFKKLQVWEIGINAVNAKSEPNWR